MTDKLYLKLALGLTGFLLLFYLAISSLPEKSSGGEQAFLTTIVNFIITFIIGQVILFVVYILNRKKNLP